MNRLALLLGLLAAFGPLSIDMYLSSLPRIGVELGGGMEGAQLTLAAFFAGMALGQLVHGPLADRFGRRPPLLAGLALYVLASVACALAPGNDALVAARFVQALTGCAGMVISRAVVRDMADRLDPVRLMGQLMLVMGVAPILAPLLGGHLAAWLGWRAIFWFLAGVGTTALVLCFLALPETLPPERRRRASPGGVLRGYGGLLRDRAFMAAALASACAIGGMFAYIAGSPFVFVVLHGVRAENYGWLFGLAAAGIIGGGQLAGRLAARFGRERVFTAALAGLAGFGGLVLAATLAGAPLAVIFAAIFGYVALMGLVLPLGTVIAVSPFPAMAGSASALLGTLQFSLGAVAGAGVAALHDGSGRPMAGLIAAAGALALAARLTLRARRSA
jgi:DHA1 family bicyclomycin/chloramphenicol resistance-like MFS transporter